MNTISIKYTLDFQLSFAKEYRWTRCGKCFNVKTGRQIKQALNNSCIGYNIKGKFYSATFLRKNLVKIEKEYYPF